MNTKSILITGARSFAALDLARIFHQAGMRVFCADNIKQSVCRYSKAVDQFYHIASPAFEFETFVEDLQKIIEEQKIDYLIPTCEEVFYIGKIKNRLNTHVFTETFEKLEILHNKWSFYELLRKLQLEIPETYLWKAGDNKPGKWILKSIYSRFGSTIQVVDKEWPHIEEDPANPRIAQKYIEGDKFCSYSICQEGKITAHSVYKVLHSMGVGSAICFQNVVAADIDDFIQKVVSEINYTGQIGFDFIRAEKLYCIECNPRATSGIHLFENNPILAQAFFEKGPIIRPKQLTIIYEPFFMLWYGIKQKECFSKQFWKDFFAGKNPLVMKGDNQVLAAMPLMFFGIAKNAFFHGRSFKQAMTYGIEYNGEN